MVLLDLRPQAAFYLLSHGTCGSLTRKRSPPKSRVFICLGRACWSRAACTCKFGSTNCGAQKVYGYPFFLGEIYLKEIVQKLSNHQFKGTFFFKI